MGTFQRLLAAVRTTPPRKIIGIILMVGAGVAMAPFLLLFVLSYLSYLPENEVVPAIVIMILAGLLLIWMVSLVCAKKLRLRSIIGVILLITLAAYVHYRFWTAEGILASNGVHYDVICPNYYLDGEAFGSTTFYEVTIWCESAHGKVDGPRIRGEKIDVGKPYRTKNGHLEFMVESPGRESWARIQLISPPEGNVAFHIVDAGGSLESLWDPQKEEFYALPRSNR
jgi:hypothetical protein